MNAELLLTLAAQAMYDLRELAFANYKFVDERLGLCLELGSRRGALTAYWNPLVDNGAAFELSVRQKIDIKHYPDHVVGWCDGGFVGTGKIEYGGDALSATRRAVVEAVALQQIGRSAQ